MRNKTFGTRFPLPGRGSQGPPPGAKPRVGAWQRAPSDWACTHGARSGTARRDDVGPLSNRLTTLGKGQGDRVQCELGSSRRRRPWPSDPQLLKLVLGTLNVTSLLGKEPQLVREVERSRLDIGHLVRMPPGRLPGEVFWACPTGRRPRGRPTIRWRDYVSRLAWERIGVPPEELEEVAGDRDVWVSLLKLLPPRPDPQRSGR